MNEQIQRLVLEPVTLTCRRIHAYVCMSIYLYMYVCLCVYLSLSVCRCLPLHLFTSLSLPVPLFVSISLFPSCHELQQNQAYIAIEFNKFFLSFPLNSRKLRSSEHSECYSFMRSNNLIQNICRWMQRTIPHLLWLLLQKRQRLIQTQTNMQNH